MTEGGDGFHWSIRCTGWIPASATPSIAARFENLVGHASLLLPGGLLMPAVRICRRDAGGVRVLLPRTLLWFDTTRSYTRFAHAVFHAILRAYPEALRGHGAAVAGADGAADGGRHDGPRCPTKPLASRKTGLLPMFRSPLGCFPTIETPPVAPRRHHCQQEIDPHGIRIRCAPAARPR